MGLERVKLMKTKVIAFDVYGTILMTTDYDNCVPFRSGFVEFAEKCIEMGIALVTSSDNCIPFTKNDLNMSGVPLDLFYDHYQMEKMQPKSFNLIYDYFGIKPEELHVFGDRPECDIDPALKLGCVATLVPVFDSLGDSFNWMSMLQMVT